MPVIEFVNCWCVCVTVCCTGRNDCAETAGIDVLSVPASRNPPEDPLTPKKNNGVSHPRKFPATLNLQDKWMVYKFNCLLTPPGVRI